MKKSEVRCFICVVATAAWLLASPAFGGELFGAVNGSLKMSYASKYIWRGYDLWNNHPAFQPDISVDVDGAYLGMWSAYSTQAGCTDSYGEVCSSWDEHDYYAGAYGSVFDGKTFGFDYDVSYTYYHFFRLSGVNTQETALNITHPNILKWMGATAPVFYWGVSYGWPVDGPGHDSRWIKLGLKENFTISEINSGILAETFWDDGGGSFQTPKGWSHVKVGGYMEFHAADFVLKPALFYQQALKTTEPNTLLESEAWFEVQAAYGFNIHSSPAP